MTASSALDDEDLDGAYGGYGASGSGGGGAGPDTGYAAAESTAYGEVSKA